MDGGLTNLPSGGGQREEDERSERVRRENPLSKNEGMFGQNKGGGNFCSSGSL